MIISFHRDFNSSKDDEIYEKDLLKSVKRWFGEDRDAADKKITTQNTVVVYASAGKRKIECRGWISRQVPLKCPMENVWSLLKVNLQGKSLFNRQQLFRHIKSYGED